MEKSASTKKISVYGLGFALICAAVAAFGPVPYGYNFAKTIAVPSNYLIFVGVFFALNAYLGNMVLGTYSLINVDFEFKQLKNFYILAISFLGAVPTGFIFYFESQHIMANYLSLMISAIIIIVNTGIGFTAIKNLLTDLAKPQPTGAKFLLRWCGFIVGLIVSSLIYAISIHSITNIVAYYWPNSYLDEIISLIAVIPWLPFAILFAYSTLAVCGNFYDLWVQSKCHKKIKFSKLSILILIVSILASCSFVQMGIEFFNPNNHILGIFKTEYFQAILYPVFLPLTLLASTAVNYFAFENLSIVLGLNNR